MIYRFMQRHYLLASKEGIAAEGRSGLFSAYLQSVCVLDIFSCDKKNSSAAKVAVWAICVCIAVQG